MHMTADDCGIFDWIAKESLKHPYTVLVFEKRTGELIGYRVTSVWFRNSEKNHFDPLPTLNEKEKLLANMLDFLKKSFWGLCPPEVNGVLRRELSCVRPDFQRRGIGNRMADEFIDEQELKAKGIDGIMSETSSVANQALLAKKGFKPLKEMEYDMKLESNGSYVPDECSDGARKMLLNFKKF
ncbi:hypothetical protein L596_024242 [Steinernema carpocapsae]|nr:hypothetical protein L596_024242 [Steinernema carpocapsae]